MTASAHRAVMNRIAVDGAELEYEVRGSGEPVLLIPPGPIAGGFVPLMSEPALAGRHGLIRYHRRGQAGSSALAPPLSFADHARDAAALLDHLDAGPAHVAGHSTGAVTALQLALDRPDAVATLALLEPTMLSVPGAQAFLAKAGPSLEAHAAGDGEGAMAAFLSVVTGLAWEECRRVIDERVPGGAAQALREAGFFFGFDVPALGAWAVGAEDAASITQPVLSIQGGESDPLFAEVGELLRSWFPDLEEADVCGAGHLLQIERPAEVAESLAAFFGRHPTGSALAVR